MSSTNAANSPSTSLSSTDIEPSTYIASIQQNWQITSEEAILPISLVSSVPFPCLPTKIIEAVHELSTLTAGQRDRAHSLLTTYFQARIREGSYSGKNKSIFAILEVDDVEKACESVRRMTKGRELQGPVPIKVEEGGEGDVGKRKYSIRDEISAEDQKPAKIPRLVLEGILEVDEVDEEEITLPPLPFTPKEEDQGEVLELPPVPATPRTKRRVRLPPIKTNALHTPLPAPSTAGFTPLFNNLKEVGLSLTPSLYQQSLQSYQPNQQPLQPRQAISYQPYQQPLPPYQGEEKIRAAQRATHEFNVRRIELMDAQRGFEQARRRFEEARGRMDRARGACGWR
jgi:hypothetical protein